MTNKYKICVYAICKNESNFVDKWMNSMSEADLVVVTDTGSNDDTVEKLKARGAIVYQEKISPWRFDVARNISLAHVPEDVDICVCTDLDEVFNVGWRNNLEKALEKYRQNKNLQALQGKYLYNWSLKDDGTPDVSFTYFKVHTRTDFKWVHPVHEHLLYEGTTPLETIFIDEMVLNHYPDSSKSRASYLPLLEMAVKEAPTNDRMHYYLGREYMYNSDWKKCIETMKNYLELPTATWPEERCVAMRWMAKSYFKLSNVGVAYLWYYKAIAEVPHMRDPYVEFAQICYEVSDWEMCYFLTKTALTIKNKSLVYVNMGYSWDFTPNDLCAIAAYNLGLFKEALAEAKAALKMSPNNKRLKNNVKLIESKL